MSLLSGIRKNILYFLVSLPLSITLYELFMMLSTGNRSWLMLSAGQIVAVPVLALSMEWVHKILSNINPLLSTLLWICLSVILFALAIAHKVFDSGTPEVWKGNNPPSSSPPLFPEGSEATRTLAIIGIILLIITPPLVYILYRVFTGKESFLSSLQSSFAWANYENFFKDLYNTLNDNDPITDSDICSVIPGTGQIVSKLPSFYFAHITFLCAYLFISAYRLFNKENSSDLRKNRLVLSMISIIVFVSVLILVRYNTGHCDSILGVVSTTVIFSALAIGWYKFSLVCGCSDLDIYGIELSKLNAAPLVCSANPV